MVIAPNRLYHGNVTDDMFVLDHIDMCPRFKRHMNLVYDFGDPTCRMVELLPHHERCAFVQNNQNCADSTFFLDYIYFYYCIMNPLNTLAVIGCILLLGVICLCLFDLLSLIAGYFLTPALKVLSKLMMLSEAVAGNTLLSFSNSAPDVLSNMTSIGSEISSLYSDCFGSCLTSVLVVCGILISVKPLTVEPFTFLRDIGFLMLDALYTNYAIRSGNKITIYEAVTCIALYVIYITIVVLDQYLENRQLKKSGQTMIDFDISSESNLNDDYTKYEYYDPSHKKNDFLFWSLGETLRPYDVDEWQRAGRCKRSYMVFQMPFRFVFKIIIPVVDFELPMHGWCKILHSAQLIILPTFLALCIMPKTAYFLVLYIFVATIPLALAVFLHSRTDLPPPYFQFYSVLAITGAAYSIYAVSKEGCAIMEVIGMTTHRSSAFLNCTLLAFGNCVAALAADFALLKQGFGKMGISACFGGPLLNTLLSLGITWVYHSTNHDDLQFTAGQGTMGTTCVIFLIISLMGFALSGLATNFVLRRSQGIFLLVLYAFFFVFAILSEFEVIHPYGAEHSMDNKPYAQ